jgi:hypothetical protein
LNGASLRQSTCAFKRCLFALAFSWLWLLLAMHFPSSLHG